jgi:hypothetical protein
MKFKITKLDGRYNGFEIFDYRLEFPYGSPGGPRQRFYNYQEIRNWMWDNYGPSCERDLYTTLNPRSEPRYAQRSKWAWHYNITENAPYIFVADDATLAHLQLKWST